MDMGPAMHVDFGVSEPSEVGLIGPSLQGRVAYV